MLINYLTPLLMSVALLLLVVCCGQEQPLDDGNGMSSVEYFSEDGTITDGELEQAWRLAEECMVERGNDAILEKNKWGYWGLSLVGEFSDPDYEECTAVSSEVSRLYWVERIPEGAERLELAESLAECFRSVDVELVYDPNAPDQAAVFRSVWEQFGYALGDRRIFDDPRFPVVDDCVSRHELLFPARFGDVPDSSEN